MKQRTKICFALMLMSLALFGLTAQVSAKASFKTFCLYNTISRFSYKADMNGDGKLDTLAFTMGKFRTDSTQNVLIKMNGTRVLLTNVPYSYGYDIQYIALSNKAQFLYIIGRGDSNMPGLHAVYRYDASRKKLVKALDLSTYLGTSGLVTKVTTKTMSVSNGCTLMPVGRVSWNYIFKYNTASGKFTLSSTSATVKSAAMINRDDGYDNYFKKSQFVAAKTFFTYTTVSMKKTAYTATVNDVLQMTKIRLYKKGLYIQFKNQEGKTGWIHAYQKYNTGNQSDIHSGIFYGVNSRLAGGFYG